MDLHFIGFIAFTLIGLWLIDSGLNAPHYNEFDQDRGHKRMFGGMAFMIFSLLVFVGWDKAIYAMHYVDALLPNKGEPIHNFTLMMIEGLFSIFWLIGLPTFTLLFLDKLRDRKIP